MDLIDLAVDLAADCNQAADSEVLTVQEWVAVAYQLYRDKLETVPAAGLEVSIDLESVVLAE